MFKAPPEVYSSAFTLLHMGELAKSESVLSLGLKQFPADYDLRYLAFEVALLRGDYGKLLPLTVMPQQAVDAYPELKNFVQGDMIDLGLALACHSGQTGLPQARLDEILISIAKKARGTLPYEMVTDDSVNARLDVLALALLKSRVDRNGAILLNRMVGLAPKDSFVLEMQADDFTRLQKHDQAVEYLKKAMAKCSKERKKHLQKKLVESEKMAAYYKFLKDNAPKGGNGGGN